MTDQEQPVEQFQIQTIQRPVEQSVCTSLFSIPWSHQCRIIDKCEDDMAKALFYVQKTDLSKVNILIIKAIGYLFIILFPCKFLLS